MSSERDEAKGQAKGLVADVKHVVEGAAADIRHAVKEATKK